MLIFIYWNRRVEFLTVLSIKKKIYLRVLAKRLIILLEIAWQFLLISDFKHVLYASVALIFKLKFLKNCEIV